MWAGSAAAQPPKFTGPGGCAAVSCHGGVQTRSETAVLQNEYSVWVVKDKHSRAYEALSMPISIRMAEILELGPANKAPRCLACHALAPPASEKAKSFDHSDGVSCESCHGPASEWLGPHTLGADKWSHAQSVAKGMIDTRDIAKRTTQCLTCHLGTKDKFVDHELIAAGHPDLYFELASFSSVMPRHWKPQHEKEPKDPWMEVHELGVGQAVQLREQMLRVARGAANQVNREPARDIWPEYADMDCFACHHSLAAAKDSWRLLDKRYYAGRRPGNAQFNLSRYSTLRKLVAQVDPGTAQQLQASVMRVHELVTRLQADRGEVAASANRAAQIADGLVGRLATVQVTPAMTMELMKAIANDGDYVSSNGERVAEQAAMALDSLFTAYKRNARPGNADQIQAAIHTLFKQLEEPSGYNGPKFAAHLRAVSGLLP